MLPPDYVSNLTCCRPLWSLIRLTEKPANVRAGLAPEGWLCAFQIAEFATLSSAWTGQFAELRYTVAGISRRQCAFLLSCQQRQYFCLPLPFADDASACGSCARSPPGTACQRQAPSSISQRAGSPRGGFGESLRPHRAITTDPIDFGKHTSKELQGKQLFHPADSDLNVTG